LSEESKDFTETFEQRLYQHGYTLDRTDIFRAIWDLGLLIDLDI